MDEKQGHAADEAAAAARQKSTAQKLTFPLPRSDGVVGGPCGLGMRELNALLTPFRLLSAGLLGSSWPLSLLVGLADAGRCAKLKLFSLLILQVAAECRAEAEPLNTPARFQAVLHAKPTGLVSARQCLG